MMAKLALNWYELDPLPRLVDRIGMSRLRSKGRRSEALVGMGLSRKAVSLGSVRAITVDIVSVCVTPARSAQLTRTSAARAGSVSVPAIDDVTV